MTGWRIVLMLMRVTGGAIGPMDALAMRFDVVMGLLEAAGEEADRICPTVEQTMSQAKRLFV